MSGFSTFFLFFFSREHKGGPKSSKPDRKSPKKARTGRKGKRRRVEGGWAKMRCQTSAQGSEGSNEWQPQEGKATPQRNPHRAPSLRLVSLANGIPRYLKMPAPKVVRARSSSSHAKKSARCRRARCTKRGFPANGLPNPGMFIGVRMWDEARALGIFD